MPSAVTLLRSSSLSPVAQYSYAASVEAGSRLIFLAGACPLDENGTTVAVGDFAAQALKAIENMLTALTEAGGQLTDVVSTRVSVASSRQEDLVAVWEVVREAFGAHAAPSTLVGVTVLGYTNQLVEVEAIAAVKEL
jgi:enamine deaminase RidA (YjgF/YER057c/UK114 family)